MLHPSAPTTIKSGLRRRFYASVIFLAAVSGACAQNRRRVDRALTTSHDPGSAEATFRDFVDCLSEFCDVKLGGDSVTAFTVLDLQDRYQYRFACNNINKSRRGRIAVAVTDLLETLRDILATGIDDESDFIVFQKILIHCRTRVHNYLRYFKEACRACKKTRPANAECQPQLDHFLRAVVEADFAGMEAEAFAQRCRELTDLIGASVRQSGTILTERTTHSAMSDSPNCWADLSHYAGRLLSYKKNAHALARAAKSFPMLLDNFEVISITSSARSDDPLQGIDVTAETLLKKMTSNTNAAAHYVGLAQEAHSLDMDHAIKEVITNKSEPVTTVTTDTRGTAIRPLVHAELLVLASLERESLTHPSYFFRSWRYIGSSKGACRLCSMYLQEHAGGSSFQLRPTHGNLYVGWRPPDVLHGDGEERIQAREAELWRLAERIGDEALRTLVERMPVGKRHDSSTGLTFWGGGLGSQGAGSVRGGWDEETSFGDAGDSE